MAEHGRADPVLQSASSARSSIEGRRRSGCGSEPAQRCGRVHGAAERGLHRVRAAVHGVLARAVAEADREYLLDRTPDRRMRLQLRSSCARPSPCGPCRASPSTCRSRCRAAHRIGRGQPHRAGRIGAVDPHHDEAEAVADRVPRALLVGMMYMSPAGQPSSPDDQRSPANICRRMSRGQAGVAPEVAAEIDAGMLHQVLADAAAVGDDADAERAKARAPGRCRCASETPANAARPC